MSEELLEPQWLARGATVAFVDNPAKERAVLHAADRIVVDDRKPFETADGRARFKNVNVRIDAEIGSVLLGDAQGRTSPDELVAIANLGNAALDLVFADDFYKRIAAVQLAP
jgi:ornithine cyclodeaminase/alanine dehydrogenase-like protein (mu-crystallin family)